MSIATSTLNGLSTGTWAIDPTHSEVGFIARHLMVTKVRGSFADVAGTVEVSDELAQSVVEHGHRLGRGVQDGVTDDADGTDGHARHDPAPPPPEGYRWRVAPVLVGAPWFNARANDTRVIRAQHAGLQHAGLQHAVVTAR